MAKMFQRSSKLRARLSSALLALAILLALPISSHAEDTSSWRSEYRMLNRRLSFSNLMIWDQKEWRTELSREEAVPTATVLVVHFWADYCKPCIEEFPWFQRMMKRLESSDVRFVMITETNAPSEMMAFLEKHRARMPQNVNHYRDSGESLLRSIDCRQLPITLLVDGQNIVRQAFVGSIMDRRNELVEGIERLRQLAQPTGTHAQRSQP